MEKILISLTYGLAVAVFSTSISFGKWNEYHSAESNHAQQNGTLILIGIVLIIQSFWAFKNQKRTTQLEKELEELKSRINDESTSRKQN